MFARFRPRFRFQDSDCEMYNGGHPLSYTRLPWKKTGDNVSPDFSMSYGLNLVKHMARPLARSRRNAQIVPRPLEDVIRDVARLFRRRDLSYSQTAYVVKEVRKRLGLAPARKARKLPDIVSWSEAERIVAAAYRRDPVGGLVVKTLWLTMVRVGELVELRVGDLRLDEGYAKIRSGKGGKDRLVVLPRTSIQSLAEEVGRAVTA